MNYFYCYSAIFVLLFNYALSACPVNEYANDIRNKANVNYRLPNDTIPLHYDLTLETDLDNFNGSVIITILIIEDTNKITLHTQNLDVIDVIVTNENFDEIRVEEIEINEALNFFIIHLAENLVENQKYYINFRQFRGKLGRDNDGFYLALYEENGVEKYVVAILLLIHRNK